MTPVGSQPATILDSFNTARKHVRALAQSDPRTFYCKYRFANRRILPGTCGYRPERPGLLAEGVEVEHVVPASHLGGDLAPWKRGHSSCREKDGTRFHGRICTRKASTLFRRMESDLYNLRPVTAAVNAARQTWRESGGRGQSEPVYVSAHRLTWAFSKKSHVFSNRVGIGHPSFREGPYFAPGWEWIW